MSADRGPVLAWSVALGLLAGMIGSPVIPSGSAVGQITTAGVLALVFVPAIYVMIRQQADRWAAKPGFVRFAVFVLTFLTATVVFDAIAGLVLGGDGQLATAVRVLAVGAGFGVTAWVTFYGGAERIWAVAVDVLDIEW